MIIPPEVLTMARIGRDVALEGSAMAIFDVAMAAVKGQVPPDMEPAVACQIITDSASASAVAAVIHMPVTNARAVLHALSTAFLAGMLERLEAIHPEGSAR